eukprot:5029715-Prorocentrum_lima.AAC.1
MLELMDIDGIVAGVLRGLESHADPSNAGPTTQRASAGKAPPPVLGETSGKQQHQVVARMPRERRLP